LLPTTVQVKVIRPVLALDDAQHVPLMVDRFRVPAGTQTRHVIAIGPVEARQAVAELFRRSMLGVSARQLFTQTGRRRRSPSGRPGE
jgi:hypothetical protein